MGWIQKLYETYENCVTRSYQGERIWPISHITQQANIEIVIDDEGKIERADVIWEQKDRLIPCTEKSAGRTSGIEPHGLADKLQYVAGDIKQYCDKPPKETEEAHRLYLEQLSDWCASAYGTQNANAVLAYVKKGTVVEDLIKKGVMTVRADGKLAEKVDIPAGEELPALMKSVTGGKQQNAFVVWKVHREGAPAEALSEDRETIQKWSAYYFSTLQEEGLCYVTGQNCKLAYMHPSKLRNTADKAKLISANDISGYVFRGRFQEKQEAVGVGYETTQKAHNALRWLISRQGRRLGGEAVLLVWATGGAQVPDIMQSSTESDFFEEAMEVHPAYTAEDYAKKLARWAMGYRQRLQHEAVVAMVVDAATTGRMAIAYYNELQPEDFIARAQHWYQMVEWWQTWHKENDEEKFSAANPFVRLVGTPSPKEIAWAAYGINADDSLKKRTVQRLLPCILEHRPLPVDIVRAVVRRAATGVMEPWELRRTIEIACALYRAYEEKEEYQMALEEERCSRDYLYGRLLAVADCLEEAALWAGGNDSNNKERQTNAMRYRQRFASHPYSTWRIVDLALSSYRKQLKNQNNKYEKTLRRVMGLFKPDEFTDDSPLAGEFLLAYYCQKDAFRNTAKQTEGEEE